MNTTAAAYRLVSVTDLRPIDFVTGKREPLVAGEGATCHRCGRLHAVVWKVERVATGEQFGVGSTCAARAFEGWTPEARDLREARKAMKSRAEQARDARFEADVVAFVAQLALVGAPPAPVVISTTVEHGRTTQVFGDPATGAKVWQHDAGPIEAERLACYTRTWLGHHATRLAGTAGPPLADKRAAAAREWSRRVADESVRRVADESVRRVAARYRPA